MTNARTEAANLHAKNIKRAGRGYVNHHNYRARILLAATVKNAA
jgi:transposase